MIPEKIYLHDAANLLLPDRRKILQGEAMLPEGIHQLGNPSPRLDTYPPRLPVHVDHFVHESQVHHASPLQPDPVGGEPRPHRPDLGFLFVGLPHDGLQLPQSLWLKEHPGVYLVGAAPVGDGVEVLRQRGIAEDLGFLVFGVAGEGKGVVGSGAAAHDESEVPQVLAYVGIGYRRGCGSVGGEGAATE